MRTILAETLVRVQARKVASSHARCYRQVHDVSVSLTDVSRQAWQGRLQTACQKTDSSGDTVLFRVTPARFHPSSLSRAVLFKGINCLPDQDPELPSLF